MLDDNSNPVDNASNLSAVAGTPADTTVQFLSVGTAIDIQALVRLNIDSILSQVTTTEQTIDLPAEFVLLHVE